MQFNFMTRKPKYLNFSERATGRHQWYGWGSFHETETKAEAALTRPRRGSCESGQGEVEARQSENHVNVLNYIHEATHTTNTSLHRFFIPEDEEFS